MVTARNIEILVGTTKGAFILRGDPDRQARELFVKQQVADGFLSRQTLGGKSRVKANFDERNPQRF